MILYTEILSESVSLLAVALPGCGCGMEIMGVSSYYILPCVHIQFNESEAVVSEYEQKGGI